MSSRRVSPIKLLLALHTTIHVRVCVAEIINFDNTELREAKTVAAESSGEFFQVHILAPKKNLAV